MNSKYLKLLAACVLTVSATSCGDSFLDTDVYDSVDENDALSDVSRLDAAVNGAYYQLQRYTFAGNYATNIGDIASDISYWNMQTSHFNDIYCFSVADTDTYLSYIWQYGYNVIDDANRVIDGAAALMENASDEEKAQINLDIAQAYALRGYCRLALSNTFCHQIKVNGQDFSSQLGIVIEDHHISATDMVSRATLGESFTAVLKDFQKSLEYFNLAGMDEGTMLRLSPQAVHGLLARTYLYLEDWQNAADHAAQAISISGINTLAYNAAAYKTLYNGGVSNSESMFALAIDSQTNWSANSSGTLWSTYNYSPSLWLQSIMEPNDVRRAVWAWTGTSTPTEPQFAGGKFSCYSTGNPAIATNYLVNAPEMFLIQAEANLKLNKVTPAQNALLVVAKRNPAITSTADLPSNPEALMSFIKDERARELFQEGHRLWDLRRWGQKVNVYATGAPAIEWMVKNYDISNLVYPIPADEINTKMGVEQNPDWNATLPSM